MATVRIEGEDRSFSARGEESLLNAALRAGLDLPYGCASGNCGLCSAQLVEGEAMPTQHSDYVPGTGERAQDAILLCCHAAASEDLLLRLPRDTDAVPAQTLTAKVRSMTRAGADILLLRLRLTRSARLRFRAGQYATLTLPGGTQSDNSMANCPCEERFLDFHLRRLPGDEFSEEAFERLRTGDEVEVCAPHGSFSIDDTSDRSSVFIAFDTGFAAIRSLLEQRTAQESARALHLLRICCSDSDLYLDNLCHSWEDALDEFRYGSYVLDQSHDAAGLDGIRAAVTEFFSGLAEGAEHDLYVCAPEEAVEKIEEVALRCGLPRERLHAEIVRGNSYSRCLADTGT